MLAPVAAKRVCDSCGVPDADGWCEATMPIESIEHGVADALRIGGGIEILGPPELRASVAETVQRIAARYPVSDPQPNGRAAPT